MRSSRDTWQGTLSSLDTCATPFIIGVGPQVITEVNVLELINSGIIAVGKPFVPTLPSSVVIWTCTGVSLNKSAQKVSLSFLKPKITCADSPFCKWEAIHSIGAIPTPPPTRSIFSDVTKGSPNGPKQSNVSPGTRRVIISVPLPTTRYKRVIIPFCASNPA